MKQHQPSSDLVVTESPRRIEFDKGVGAGGRAEEDEHSLLPPTPCKSLWEPGREKIRTFPAKEMEKLPQPSWGWAVGQAPTAQGPRSSAKAASGDLLRGIAVSGY